MTKPKPCPKCGAKNKAMLQVDIEGNIYIVCLAWHEDELGLSVQCGHEGSLKIRMRDPIREDDIPGYANELIEDWNNLQPVGLL